ARDLPAHIRRLGRRERRDRRLRAARLRPRGRRDRRPLDSPVGAVLAASSAGGTLRPHLLPRNGNRLMATTNDIKNGAVLNLDGQLWSVIEFQHVKPGKGGAFVRTKLRNARSQKTVDKTF